MKVTAKLEVMENLKNSWKVKEFEELRRLWATSLVCPMELCFGMMDSHQSFFALEVYVKTSGHEIYFGKKIQ